jgi:hypothetical protein
MLCQPEIRIHSGAGGKKKGIFEEVEQDRIGTQPAARKRRESCAHAA